MSIILFLQLHCDIPASSLDIPAFQLLFAHLISALELLNDHLLMFRHGLLLFRGIKRILSVFAGRSDLEKICMDTTTDGGNRVRWGWRLEDLKFFFLLLTLDRRLLVFYQSHWEDLGLEGLTIDLLEDLRTKLWRVTAHHKGWYLMLMSLSWKSSVYIKHLISLSWLSYGWTQIKFRFNRLVGNRWARWWLVQYLYILNNLLIHCSYYLVNVWLI